jgi:hypothetical protein
MKVSELRKPVDLALENLVTMSLELDPAREKLVLLLFLPLDSQIFGNPLIFTLTFRTQHLSTIYVLSH